MIYHVIKLTEGDVLDWTTLLTYMREGESPTRKFYTSIDSEDEIGPTITALANTDGGKFFIGIDLKNYHLWGTSISREWLALVVKNNCSDDIELTIDFIEKNGKLILVGDVNEGQKKPYYYKNTCYIMDGATPKVALLEKVNNRFDSLESLTNLSEDEFEEQDIAEITNELISLNLDHNPESSSEPENNGSFEIDINSAPKEIVIEDPVIVTSHQESRESSHDLNKRQLDSLEFLKGNEFIKNKMYRELFDVSHKTAHLELVDLVKKGYLDSVGSGRSTRYITSTKELIFDSL